MGLRSSWAKSGFNPAVSPKNVHFPGTQRKIFYSKIASPKSHALFKKKTRLMEIFNVMLFRSFNPAVNRFFEKRVGSVKIAGKETYLFDMIHRF